MCQILTALWLNESVLTACTYVLSIYEEKPCAGLVLSWRMCLLSAACLDDAVSLGFRYFHEYDCEQISWLCMCIHVFIAFVNACVCVAVKALCGSCAVWMIHPVCQDDASFVRHPTFHEYELNLWLHACIKCLCMCSSEWSLVWVLCCLDDIHLLSAACQDDASFVRHPTFRKSELNLWLHVCIQLCECLCMCSSEWSLVWFCAVWMIRPLSAA